MGGIRTIKRSGGSRWYVHETGGSGEPVMVPGVTSIIDMLPSDWKQYWASKLVAERAVDSLRYLAEMVEDDREGAINYLKGAPVRYANSRARIGSRAHDLFERIIRGEPVGRQDAELEPYRRNFDDFLRTVKPELVWAEDVAWSQTHGYAGSFDAVLRVYDPEEKRHLNVITDWKTSKAAYSSVSLQLTAYSRADYIITPKGETCEMPEIDAGAILHITPERWEFRPVEVSDRVFRVFLALMTVFQWEREISPNVIGVPFAEGGRIVTGTERRA